LDRRAYIGDDATGWLCGTGTIQVRVKEGVSSRAVFHSIGSVHTVRRLNGNAVGTTMPNLNSNIVGRIPVALPPEPRQMMVVECLEELKQGIQELKDRLTQARQIRSKLLNQVGSIANGVQ
jgi:type I restriction enzyme, S subunit